MGWQPVESLEKLEGFTDPWEFGVCRGRALKMDGSLAENGITSDATVTIVRRMLIPEVWKVCEHPPAVLVPRLGADAVCK